MKLPFTNSTPIEKVDTFGVPEGYPEAVLKIGHIPQAANLETL